MAHFDNPRAWLAGTRAFLPAAQRNQVRIWQATSSA